MTKAWEWIRKWAWALVLGLVTLLLAGRKPTWVRHKEQEIKARDKEIAKAQDDAEDVSDEYEEVKANHDEAIRQEIEGRPPITDADNAASFVDDILDKRK